jgi:uncharacterized protein YdbL (DUF1318 family)
LGRTIESAPPLTPQSQQRFSPWRLASLSLVGEAQAQEADINVSNPAIRAIKDSIKARSEAIKPFMDRGNIGIAADGLLAIRNTDGLNLKERAETKQLVDAENRDRENLYVEIAKANNIPADNVPKIKIFSPKAGSIKPARAGGSRTASATGRKNEAAIETSSKL